MSATKDFIGTLLFLCLVSYIGFASPYSNTHAVIIGISDYQDEDIDDLQYAHRDAEAFADYLLNVYPGKVDAGNLHLLTNEKATGGQVHKGLNRLINNAQKGDRVIIYFAGHGDVETEEDAENGHLLLYDTPANMYPINSLRINDLNKIISELSTQIGSEVIVITDACRSGKLAGSGINGTNLTANSLALQLENETKILSCQPDEYSLEGSQWGGGRGLFSLHLIEGLIGLADANNDLQVSLRELRRFLEDTVEPDAEPRSQSPMILGDKSQIISFVADDELVELVKDKAEDNNTSLEQLSQIYERSIDILSPELAVERDLFYEALFEKRLMSDDSKGSAAIDHYEKLIEEGAPNNILQGLKGDLVALLQDKAQQVINDYLSSNNQVIIDQYVNYGEKYKKYPEYLKKAAELLGEENYLYRQLIAKSFYFEGVLEYTANSPGRVKYPDYIRAKSLLQKSLSYDSRAAYVYNVMGIIELLEHNDLGAKNIFEKAYSISPNWAVVNSNLSRMAIITNEINDARVWANKAIELKPNYAKAHWNLATVEWIENGIDGALEVLNNYIDIHGDDYLILSKLGILYGQKKQWDKGISSLKKSLKLAEIYDSYHELGWIFLDTNQPDSALFYFEKALERNPYETSIISDLAGTHVNMNNDKEALSLYLTAKELKPKGLAIRKSIGMVSFRLMDYRLAQTEFEYVIQNTEADDYESEFYLAKIFAAQKNKVESEKHLLIAIKGDTISKEMVLGSSEFTAIFSEEELNQILGER